VGIAADTVLVYVGTKPITGLVPIPMLKRILRSWHFWILVPAYLFYATGIQSYNYFTIYLKAANYSVQLRNVLPATSYVLQIPFEFSYGWISDRIGSRFLLCLIPLLWGIFPTGVLAVWPESNGLKVASFMVMGTMFITHVFITWLNEICRDSPEERGFLIASTNTLFFA
jgi:ACS family pantothenate transporter-like MFS transporter